MTSIEFEGVDVQLDAGESVLDGLLRSGYKMTSGCRSGVCQSCVLQSDSDGLSAFQSGLSAVQKRLGYFLACQCRPNESLSVHRVDTGALTHRAVVTEKYWLTDRVIKLVLRADLGFLPGQYVTLSNSAGVARCYSIANLCDGSGLLEFHLRYYPDGAFSSFVGGRLNVGDELQLQGPMGNCIYAAAPDQPLLFMASGTGLAPLYGVAREALRQGHKGAMHLLLAGKTAEDFYLQDALLQLQNSSQQTAASVGVTLVSQFSAGADEVQGLPCVQADFYDFCREHYPDLQGHKVYICGPDTFTAKLRKQCFLGGAAMSDIAVDSFTAFA